METSSAGEAPERKQSADSYDDSTNYAGVAQTYDAVDANADGGRRNPDDEELLEDEANLSRQAGTNAAQVSELESLCEYVSYHVRFLVVVVLLLGGLASAGWTVLWISFTQSHTTSFFPLDLPAAKYTCAALAGFLTVVTFSLSYSVQRALAVKEMLHRLSREQRTALGLVSESGFFVDPTILLKLS
ncbi:hypothetical protein VOI32_18550 [Paraburkholderia caribensis]|uniref:Uncharacterized protein n=1 Tax=Paraburkholderia caribensis TaxID=75105 RepID=A0A9Q6S185_9BURK|nr:hypothetical protein [Paraburkholderia caribensis]MCO4879927.1 hypothetical protein [Paraburkholderia caribensis]PTB27766.1 hypothetical protein C9I56_16255 [Paraburkholderia caribensis]QLB62952.1 hypothetical protein A9O66_11500 [Paraburkholderia caribensis]